MRLPLTDIVRSLDDLGVSGRPVLVGIDGGAGAGKTTFARQLEGAIAREGADVSVVHVDGFYKCASDRWSGPIDDQPVGHDLDWERLRDEALVPLRSGRSACYRPFDWPQDSLLGPVHVEPEGIVIVEGVFGLRSELSDIYDLRIWLTCPRDLRKARILERGDMTPAELDRWMPSEAAYVAAHAPDSRAHLVIDSTVEMWRHDGTQCVEARHWSPPSGRTG